MTRRRWLLLFLLLILLVAGTFVFFRLRQPELTGRIFLSYDINAVKSSFWLDPVTGVLEPFEPGRSSINGPHLSPDGTEMVYSGFGLHVHNFADGLTRQITDGARESNPRWSPDGAYIVFTKSENFFSALFRYTVATGEVVQLTDFQNDLDPGWSPDGTRIVFTTSRDGFQEIYTMNPDGSGLQRMTHNELINDLQPQYSPDGRHIAYMTNYSVGDGTGEIWVMDADGTNHRQITDNDLYDSNPQWSPDGRYIIFLQSLPATTVKIFIFDFQTGEIHGFTPLPGYISYTPVWSPDSQWIAFASRDVRGSDGAIYISRLDGSDLRRLTEEYRVPRLLLWIQGN